MNNGFKLLDWITLISFGIGLYALYIALVNLEMNDEQSGELKDILHYLENLNANVVDPQLKEYYSTLTGKK